jgi:hypothetical protein
VCGGERRVLDLVQVLCELPRQRTLLGRASTEPPPPLGGAEWGTLRGDLRAWQEVGIEERSLLALRSFGMTTKGKVGRGASSPRSSG